VPIIIEGSLEDCIEKARQISADIEDNVRWKIVMEPIFATHYRCFEPRRRPRLRLIKRIKVSDTHG